MRNCNIVLFPLACAAAVVSVTFMYSLQFWAPTLWRAAQDY